LCLAATSFWSVGQRLSEPASEEDSQVLMNFSVWPTMLAHNSGVTALKASRVYCCVSWYLRLRLDCMATVCFTRAQMSSIGCSHDSYGGV